MAIRKDRNSQQLMEQVLLDHYSAPSVLINEKYEALYFHGPTDHFLVPPRGEASLNVLNMCREGLRGKLSSLLRRAVSGKTVAALPGVKLVIEGVVITFVDITDITLLGQELKKARKELGIMNTIASAFLLASDEDDYTQVLDIILTYMESPLGLLGHMGERGEMVVPSLAGDIWDGVSPHDRTLVLSHDRWGTIWESAMREKRSVPVHNGLGACPGGLCRRDPCCAPGKAHQRH